MSSAGVGAQGEPADNVTAAAEAEQDKQQQQQQQQQQQEDEGEGQRKQQPVLRRQLSEGQLPPQLPDSSRIVRFYRDGAQDCMHRTLSQMLQYDDASMERCHDHMQWMFPLHEPSMFSDEDHHEVLTPLDIQQLSSSSQARANMSAAALHFRAFLGVGEVQEPRKWRAWAHSGNHNLLRVTRAIRSMRLFGLEEEAQSFYDAVEQVARKAKLPDSTLVYWTTALKDPPMASLRKPRGRAGGRGGQGQSDPQSILEMLLGMHR